MTIRYRYYHQMEPPAPFVRVSLRDPATGRELRDVPAQLDFAADRTVVPDHMMQSLGVPQQSVLQMAGLGGATQALPSYILQIAVHTLPAQTLKVVGCKGESWILLGRDVLNTMRLFLDGPQLALEIH